ncbi:DUF1254 domain-containing protein [Iningainema tapete]|uniref:DUF1254 domain-containing protein n=1 Tax=Iningainema tapete BLCC-T55 TaxID=2748662 RepID=A0A8J6XD56_9CYAN|nr:DUF1214 domain-containing protein [Iningainema tapete]MBD2770920.1 DUF1254 domain-containing protein [Iningainema tapete BLCC-T55]
MTALVISGIASATDANEQSVAAGLPVIKSPTNTVWALGRTLVDGPADLQAVRSQYTLTPLSLYPGSPPTELPPIPNPNPLPRPQDVAKSGIQFFDELSALLKDNPPPADESPVLERFAQVGIGVNRQPSQEVTDPDILAGLTQGIVEAERLIDKKWLNIGTTTNGWRVNYDIGDYGNDYLLRAAVAKYALAANVAQESLYFLTNIDANGNPLVGTNEYVLTFEAGQLPPVEAFWSVTLYDPDGFLVENSINRYSIGDRTPGVQFNSDGSLSIYLQSDPPILGSSNWLPTQNGPFSLSLRAYLPKPELLNGTYQLPPVVNVAATSVPESSATSGMIAASIVGAVVLRSRRQKM